MTSLRRRSMKWAVPCCLKTPILPRINLRNRNHRRNRKAETPANRRRRLTASQSGKEQSAKGKERSAKSEVLRAKRRYLFGLWYLVSPLPPFDLDALPLALCPAPF